MSYSEEQTNAAGEVIHYDESGQVYVLDENGNRRPPMQATGNSEPGAFTTYDTSQGHCALCGSLTCNGGCFK